MDTEYIYFSQKILYTRTVAGGGGSIYIQGGPTLGGPTRRIKKNNSGRAHPGRAHPENKKKTIQGGPTPPPTL